MNLFGKNTTAPTTQLPAPTGRGPAISLDKIPGSLVNLTKAAAVSLEKAGLTGQRAAVYLVLDHSGSMSNFYADGSVQRLAEQALGLSANLDDDGNVPLIYFASQAHTPITTDLHNYAGIVDRTHSRTPWGTTDYVAAMNAVISDYRASGQAGPAFVIFQTDGAPNDRRATERALKDASKLPIFWAFVGFGGRVEFLEKLDGLRRGRKVDNASFFHAANPHTVTDDQLYDGLTHEYAGWLAAATAAGILT
ncbi:VWA domain-containing protein [Streptomyces sp. NBC_01433]|uniref:VWA domain-containing protein n=1 Tax=Streptomyces sp. NBC_01433 TaxID=2903864 RepID=UPI00224CF9C7|nr:VWA domain-containing protein [Streptomyces sp. NBC_01433]MCX4681362.1 VWA domain-containing protein [Streptomyces sp. NBC_01433]MCX4681700.1 VWA domain-containing protein [Streptomyces sp. NBC_01433]MCX4682438.1 VWA domain-containing protein [Streptomyces sp. NBC_01433]